VTVAGLEDLPEVQRWFTGAGYASAPVDERRRLVEELEAFCAHAGKQPAELIRSCLLTTRDGNTKISIKGRRAMQLLIDGYIADRGLSGHTAVAAGNRIRGFLIHNGVFIQGRAAIG
jgi:hypothetical protein